jgi:ferric-dicitrate binding protein FerR (iron transport regulator)
MSDLPPDPELRALFEAQRDDDARHAPTFSQLMARAQAEAATAAAPATVATPRTRWRREWAGGLAAAAAIAALIVIPRVRSGDDAFEQAVRAFQSNPALGAWQSPTDGLLTLPGDRLLSTVPTMGTETR